MGEESSYGKNRINSIRHGTALRYHLQLLNLNKKDDPKIEAARVENVG
ncbi:MAG: hypothetical protein P4M01_08790 [Acidobacteriota bacterium]|nr:hypothetical protein [Acidobacteriota bacterium]